VRSPAEETILIRLRPGSEHARYVPVGAEPSPAGQNDGRYQGTGGRVSPEDFELEIFRQTCVDHARNWNLTDDPMRVAILVACGDSEDRALDQIEITDELERQRILQAMRWGIENPRWEPTPEEVDEFWREIEVARPDFFRKHAPPRYRHPRRWKQGGSRRP